MTILKTAPSPNGRLFMQLRLERGGLLLVCANTLKTKTKTKKNGQVALTRLAQGPGAGIVSCRLHDSTFIRTAASTW